MMNQLMDGWTNNKQLTNDSQWGDRVLCASIAIVHPTAKLAAIRRKNGINDEGGGSALRQIEIKSRAKQVPWEMFGGRRQ